MARIRITHRTEYHYTRPILLGRHRLVLRPREGHDLRVESMELAIAPAHRLVWSRDVFGNSIAIVDFTEPAELLEIVSDVLVFRTMPFPDQTPHEPWSVPFPVTYDPLEIAFASAYEIAIYPDEVPELKGWVDLALGGANKDDAESVVSTIGTLIREQIKYQRRSEKGVQSPLATLKLGSGSCRDMATLMMEALRCVGIAARFASGYLDCAASAAGHASTHAWTEVYLPDLGWRGFDPTTGQPTGLKHVVTGVSNHPRGVMPVSGKFTGTSADYQQMIVQVRTETLPKE
jgi:transglutaminase-like putative cysteine protease